MECCTVNIDELKLDSLVGKSDMTVGEMITSFRQAKDRRLQLHALAELTLLQEEQIKDILIAFGVSYKLFPRARRKKDHVEVKPEDREKCKPEPKPAPEPAAKPAPGPKRAEPAAPPEISVSYEMLHKLIDDMAAVESAYLAKVAALEAENRELKEKLDRVREFLRGGADRWSIVISASPALLSWPRPRPSSITPAA